MPVAEGSTALPNDGSGTAKYEWGVYDGTNFWLPRADNSTAKNLRTTLYDQAGRPLLKVDDAAWTAGDSTVPAGFVYDDTSTDILDEGDAGYGRVTNRRELYTAADTSFLTLTSGSPTPTDNRGVTSDIVAANGAALASTDFQIRNNATHIYAIPMTGWRRLVVVFRIVTASFDQAFTLQVLAATTNNGWAVGPIPQLLSVSISSGFAAGSGWSIGNGAVGTGGSTGGATVANQNHYPVPAMTDGFPWMLLRLVAAGNPTQGDIEITVARSRN